MQKRLMRLANHICFWREVKHPQTNIIFKVIIYGLKIFLSIMITSLARIRYIIHNVKPLDDKSDAPVVCLTTYPARIKKVWLVIDSLYNQTIKPSKIYVVLTKEEFPNELKDLPSNLKRFIGFGVNVIFVEENLRPHNKYYYALLNIKNRDIITVDDDLLYWEDTIERLVGLQKKNENSICTNKALFIEYKNGVVLYSPKTNSKNTNLMAQGVCGVLYNKNIRITNLFDKKMIKSTCLTNDDVWLHIQEIRAGLDVAVGDYYCHPLIIINSQKQALWHKNICHNESSKTMQNLISYYKLEYKYENS